jgi:predicted DNA-binding transcriptional regulator AlpA
MKYLTLNQLSEKLANRSRSSILRDVESGLLPKPTKFGGRLYWVDSEIDDAFNAQREAA